MAPEITKIGLAVMDGDHLLLVKKKGSDFLILPGGKPETGETDVQTLSRELNEELGCGLVSNQLRFVGTFFDEAAGLPDTKVTIRLYAGALIGTPTPSAEIESIVWWARAEHQNTTLAPSLRNSILPFLHQNNLARNHDQRSRQAASPR